MNFISLKYLSCFIPFLWLASPTQNSSCERLKNGDYHVEMDKMFSEYKNYDLKISDSTATLIRSDTTEHYKINWLYDCSFRFKDDKPREQTPAEILLKGLGEPYFDIIKTTKDTSYFILRINLHIQIYTGKFIKKTE
jgi:hypothetical protein